VIIAVENNRIPEFFSAFQGWQHDEELKPEKNISINYYEDFVSKKKSYIKTIFSGKGPRTFQDPFFS
jgi:hypothetical protein